VYHLVAQAIRTLILLTGIKFVLLHVHLLKFTMSMRAHVIAHATSNSMEQQMFAWLTNLPVVRGLR
jgi:hypothetical protein